VRPSERPTTTLHVLLDRQRPETSWKNSGGATWEVACSPGSDGLDRFDWRVSTARIERDGPFSMFPGIDRLIVPAAVRCNSNYRLKEKLTFLMSLIASKSSNKNNTAGAFTPSPIGPAIMNWR
jgi:hypothetical protein